MTDDELLFIDVFARPGLSAEDLQEETVEALRQARELGDVSIPPHSDA